MDNHKTLLRDFPGGPVVKSPLCNAGDMGSIPGQGTEIPHTTEQLSPLSATAREFALPQKIPRATTRTQPKKPYEVQWQGWYPGLSFLHASLKLLHNSSQVKM